MCLKLNLGTDDAIHLRLALAQDEAIDFSPARGVPGLLRGRPHIPVLVGWQEDQSRCSSMFQKGTQPREDAPGETATSAAFGDPNRLFCDPVAGGRSALMTCLAGEQQTDPTIRLSLTPEDLLVDPMNESAPEGASGRSLIEIVPNLAEAEARRV